MKVLILGCTGGIGTAVTLQYLKKENVEVFAFARNFHKANDLFKSHKEKLNVIQGNVENLESLKNACHEAGPFDIDVIFYGINYPYHEWQTKAIPALQNVIAVAKQWDARLLFPANVYSLKPVFDKPLKEDCEIEPTTAKGKIRQQMETLLKESGVKCLAVRAGDYFGPSVSNQLIDMTFVAAVKFEPIQHFSPLEGLHDQVYVKDLAKVFVELSLLPAGKLKQYEVVHFQGHCDITRKQFYESIVEEAYKLRRIEPKPAKFTHVPWAVVLGKGLFDKTAKEFYDMRYIQDNRIILDDSHLKELLPTFQRESLRTAIVATLKEFL